MRFIIKIINGLQNELFFTSKKPFTIQYVEESYLIKIEKLHTDNFYFHELKKMRFKINNRTRKFSDLSEIKNNFNDNFFKSNVINISYINLITDELTLLSYSYETKGQIINVLNLTN